MVGPIEKLFNYFAAPKMVALVGKVIKKSNYQVAPKTYLTWTEQTISEALRNWWFLWAK
jgi:hypothetical protein